MYVNAQCVNKARQTAHNLWQVFQCNGHIGSNLSFPDDLEDYSPSKVTEAMLEAVRKNPISKAEAKSQRLKFMMDAYSQVPRDLIRGIHHRYKLDFKMFGYKADMAD